MDDFEWIKNLPEERLNALIPVYQELEQVHKQNRIDGMKRFHTVKTNKLLYLQGLEKEAQDKSNDWHDRLVKLEQAGAKQESKDTAWKQCEYHSRVASDRHKEAEILWDQVTLITLIIDDHDKTSIFPTLYRLTGDSKYIGGTFDRMVDLVVDFLQHRNLDSTSIADDQKWMFDKLEFMNEFLKRRELQNTLKRNDLSWKSLPNIYKTMISERPSGLPPIAEDYESFRVSLNNKFPRKKGKNK
jgi:hypothetical protein